MPSDENEAVSVVACHGKRDVQPTQLQTHIVSLSRLLLYLGHC